MSSCKENEWFRSPTMGSPKRAVGPTPATTISGGTNAAARTVNDTGAQRSAAGGRGAGWKTVSACSGES